MIINQLWYLCKIFKNMAPIYYAVAKGRKPGIYNTWDECKLQVFKFSGPIYKKFNTKVEADNFIKQHSNSGEKNNKKVEVPTFGKRLQSERDLSLDVDNEKLSAKKLKKASSQKCSIEKNVEHKKAAGEFIVSSNGYVDVYTDGACSSNGYQNAQAGIGVWFGDDHPLNVSEAVIGRATNNMAEIQAVTIAAKQAKKAGIKKLRINTDSRFLISCINDWMPRWKNNGWKTSTNKPVINKIELLEMEKALESLDISWNHVNGHVGIYGNEMADQLARAGCLKYSKKPIIQTN